MARTRGGADVVSVTGVASPSLLHRRRVTGAHRPRFESRLLPADGTHDVPSILYESIVVDRGNLDATIIADGYHSRHDVYGP